MITICISYFNSGNTMHFPQDVFMYLMILIIAVINHKLFWYVAPYSLVDMY
jgi:hypothetical protein